MIFTLAVPANAINVASGARSWWGYDGGKDSSGSVGDFMIAGALGMAGMHGTFDDEWAVVGMVAQKIVEHGGYFCPYQIQCANKNKKRASWTMYYYPTGYASVGCSWICEPGYGGENCLSKTSYASCDTKIYGTNKGQKFGGLSLKTSGGNSNQKESEVSGFNQWGTDPESDVVLGIVRFMNHGVVAGPVKITCDRNGYKDAKSFVKSVDAAVGNQKLLCANGYTANSSGTDCEPISADACATQNLKFCDNFPRGNYDSSLHTIQESTGCAKYFCTDTTKAFPKIGDFSCSDCSTSIKGGVSKINGVCVKCQTGQYFDSNTSTCQSADAYTKSDLQYGKNVIKNDKTVTDQCWTMVTPDDYRKCVTGSNFSPVFESPVYDNELTGNRTEPNIPVVTITTQNKPIKPKDLQPNDYKLQDGEKYMIQ